MSLRMSWRVSAALRLKAVLAGLIVCAIIAPPFLWYYASTSGRFSHLDDVHVEVTRTNDDFFQAGGGHSSLRLSARGYAGPLMTEGMASAAPPPRAASFVAAPLAALTHVALKASGFQDANSLFENVRSGFLPRLSAVQYEGLLAQHSFDVSFADTGATSVQVAAAAPVSPRTMLYPAFDVICGAAPPPAARFGSADSHFIAVGLGSNIDASTWTRPALDAVFVIDVSSSMSSAMQSYFYGNSGELTTPTGTRLADAPGPQKLGVARDITCHILLKLMRPGDTAAVVTFSDSAETLVPRTPLATPADARNMCEALRALSTRGATNLDAGYARGLAELPQEGAQARARRVFVLTDEQPNVFEERGIVQEARDAALLRKTYTTVVGVGMDFQADIAARLRALPGAAVFSAHQRDAFFAQVRDAAPWRTDYSSAAPYPTGTRHPGRSSTAPSRRRSHHSWKTSRSPSDPPQALWCALRPFMAPPTLYGPGPAARSWRSLRSFLRAATRSRARARAACCCCSSMGSPLTTRSPETRYWASLSSRMSRRPRASVKTPPSPSAPVLSQRSQRLP